MLKDLRFKLCVMRVITEDIYKCCILRIVTQPYITNFYGTEIATTLMPVLNTRAMKCRLKIATNQKAWIAIVAKKLSFSDETQQKGMVVK